MTESNSNYTVHCKLEAKINVHSFSYSFIPKKCKLTYKVLNQAQLTSLHIN